jgi:FkbM family methyltransferase
MSTDTDYKHVPTQILAGLKRSDQAPFDPLLCAYQYLLERLGIARTGVLHLGGHIGQELPMYAALGFRRVVMVEPLEHEFAQLQKRVEEFNATCGPIASFINEPVIPRAHAVRCAVSDRVGESGFYRTNMTSLSSLSKPIPGNFSEPDEDLTALSYQEVKVPCQTLDGLVAELPHGWKESDFSYLRMNIQGAELRALQGGTRTLRHISLIDLETNIDMRYEGAPSKDAFDQLLSGYGFSSVFGYRIGSMGNLVYARIPTGARS